jgi:hypothetical protein
MVRMGRTGRRPSPYVLARAKAPIGIALTLAFALVAGCTSSKPASSKPPLLVTGSPAVGVWQNRSGSRVPVTKIQSYQGPEHCDWQDITFLVLGPQSHQRMYLRDTTGELNDYLRTTYDSDADLPHGATDTGYHRSGRELWFGPRNEAAYLVSLRDRRHVERWPAEKKFIGCG